MIWKIAAGVMLGLAPFSLMCVGAYILLASDDLRRPLGIDWKAGSYFAVSLLIAGAVIAKAFEAP